MSMISCPECSKKVSDTSLKCPSCGVQLKIATRSFMGKLFKWLFILFNLFMPFFIFVLGGATSDVMDSAGSASEEAGTAIAGGLSMMFSIIVWVVGDIILGFIVLMTRPKS